jgi:hypothetical protein
MVDNHQNLHQTTDQQPPKNHPDSTKHKIWPKFANAGLAKNC